jgi:hypothetical protein
MKNGSHANGTKHSERNTMFKQIYLFAYQSSSTKRYIQSYLFCIVSEWLLPNTKQAIFYIYINSKQVTFNEIVMVSAFY